MDPLPSGTRQKALVLNLDKAKYGTIADIVAGQEVARWFFLGGGAAGTVAIRGPAPVLHLPLAESCLTPALFRQILGWIEGLAWHPT